ncbi:hypothetical protein RQP46_008975 [Phenoliferia psychrophenolica]
MAQDLILDTLEPDQCLHIATKALRMISDDDLTSVPLVDFQRGVAAHAAAPITQALLKFLPQLAGRIKADNHEYRCIGNSEYPSHRSTSTTYHIKTMEGDWRTLVVDTVQGRISSSEFGGGCSSSANFKYTIAGPDPITAQFSHDYSYSNQGTLFTLSSSNLSQLFHKVAEDLQLPVTSSSELVALEKSHAKLQEKAHGVVDLLSALPLKLRTPDTIQRDLTFGRLVRGLVPRCFRREKPENNWILGFIMKHSEVRQDMETLLRGAAVAGVDLDHEDGDF